MTLEAEGLRSERFWYHAVERGKRSNRRKRRGGRVEEDNEEGETARTCTQSDPGNNGVIYFSMLVRCPCRGNQSGSKGERKSETTHLDRSDGVPWFRRRRKAGNDSGLPFQGRLDTLKSIGDVSIGGYSRKRDEAREETNLHGRRRVSN